jgi:PTH1 family peptidyl-tRNA hydrolase
MNFLEKIRSLLSKESNNPELMKKFLIVGLGNVGEKYNDTRHNIGFSILDRLATKEKVIFETKKLGDLARFKYKGRTFILLKPNTYMNLSGKAVSYWQKIEKIPLENIFVITDDLNLDFGMIRIKPRGSAGGHNGLTNINEHLQTQNYSRLRFGVDSEFKRGGQVDYVLNQWSEAQKQELDLRIEKSTKAIKSFALAGLNNTMNEFNGK